MNTRPSSRVKWWIASSALILGGAFVLWKANSRTAAPEFSSPGESTNSPKTSEPSPSPTSAHAGPQGEVDSAPEWAKSPILSPDSDTVRKESQEDPHRTPPSLIALAPQFAEMMEASEKSEEMAKKAFERFEECARDDSDRQLIQVRLACAMNAKRIAAQRPELFQAPLQNLMKDEFNLFEMVRMTDPEE